MPLSQYFLLALLATGGVASLDGSPTTASTLGADALGQPNGGAMSSAYLGQEPPKKDDIHLKRLSKTRHRRKGKTAHKPIKADEPKKDGGKRSSL